jgi:hypothetical protein
MNMQNPASRAQPPFGHQSASAITDVGQINPAQPTGLKSHENRYEIVQVL